jgi:hypothetical protein
MWKDEIRLTSAAVSLQQLLPYADCYYISYTEGRMSTSMCREARRLVLYD